MTNDKQLYYYNSAILTEANRWEDMWAVYGIAMGSGFLAALYAPAAMKDYVEGESRLEHGKTVITANARTDSRDVTLTFNIHGSSEEEYHSRRDTFYTLLYKGAFTIKVAYKDSDREDIFHLIYKKSTSYTQSYSRHVGTIAVKFEEPNVMNRTV